MYFNKLTCITNIIATAVVTILGRFVQYNLLMIAHQCVNMRKVTYTLCLKIDTGPS